MIIQPNFLKNITVNYIEPVLPEIVINYSHVHPMIYLVVACFIAGFSAGSFRFINRNSIIALMVVLALILFIICKKMIITQLIDKTIEVMVDFNTNYHMKCHDSCNKTFEPNLTYDFDTQLATMKDGDFNTLNGVTFDNNDYKKHNQTMLQKSIKFSKDECTYNCVNEEVILVNKVYNDIPYYRLKKDYTLQLNSLNHLFFIGDGSESQKRRYRDIIMRYFDFTFAFQ